MIWYTIAITVLVGALAVPATMFALRYQLHMFQLNGYSYVEHGNWLKKNLKTHWLLAWDLLLGAAGLVTGLLVQVTAVEIVLDVLMVLSLALTILIYNVLRGIKAKKKLVYTARVKRMIVTDCLLMAGGIAAVVLTGNWPVLGGCFTALTGIQLFILFAVNGINRPAELAVSRYYINDAKRILRKNPNLTVIGVTGSYGKTSVKFYLKTLLEGHFNVLVTPESYNTPMGVVKTIRGMMRPEHEIFVCEMGAKKVGDIRAVCRIVHPQHGLITSIGPQHLETFFTMKNIQKTKFELADSLPKGGLLFANGDNEYICEKAAEGRYDACHKVFYHSEKQGEGYYAKDVTVSQLGTEFTVVAPDGGEVRFSMRLVGAHNVINVVGAIAVAHELGIPMEELKLGVRRIEPVAHRMQLLERGAVTIIDDAYNSNPVGSKAAVETLALFAGTRILITPGMVELGVKEEEFNYLFGTYAAECCDYIALVGRKHTEPILKGILEKGFDPGRCQVFDRFEDAMNYANSLKTEEHKYILLENDLPDNY